MKTDRERKNLVESGRVRLASLIAIAGLSAPAMIGCGPADVGTISAPAPDRSRGPTSDPNAPGGGSVIPTEDVHKGGKAGRSK